MPEYQFSLNEPDFQLLLLALGYATGAAFAKHDSRLACTFIQLINVINKDNPNWTPYVLPESGEDVYHS